jgi:hypothetical protein
VRLITRHGSDFTSRFPLAPAAVTALPASSFLIDGEAIVTNGDGLGVFNLIRHKRQGDKAVLCAFDLIEPDGRDLRRSPIERCYPTQFLCRNAASCRTSCVLRRARPQRPAACPELLTRAVEADILFLSGLQNLAGLGVDEMNPPASGTRPGFVNLDIG